MLNIPVKILNSINYLTLTYINSIDAYVPELNNCLKKGVFPDDLKLADITPIYKNGRLSK